MFAVQLISFALFCVVIPLLPVAFCVETEHVQWQKLILLFSPKIHQDEIEDWPKSEFCEDLAWIEPKIASFSNPVIHLHVFDSESKKKKR